MGGAMRGRGSEGGAGACGVGETTTELALGRLLSHG